MNYSIKDDIEILGHVFHGLQDIKDHVELSLYRSYKHGMASIVEPIKKCEVHVGEMWSPYPCFDSEDYLYENRTYQNYIFRSRPITQDDMRKLSELPSGPAERRFLALTWYVPKRSGEENGRVTDDMILRFKSRGDFAGFFASELARELERTLGRCGEEPAGWTVSWCPRSPEKFMETGFDQGEELAARVAKKLGIPSRSLFTRLSRSAEQKELGAEDRRRNAEEGLVLRQSAVKTGMKVLLLDDIVTTGSTLRAAASLLYGAGAETVFPAVLARTRRSGGKKT